MPMTPLPPPPTRQDPEATFVSKANAFLGALPTFVTQANALETAVDADAVSAAASASASAASAAASATSANIAAGAANYQGAYNAGTTYQIGQSVDFGGRRWVARTINTGVTPVEGANWFLINDGDVTGPASATNNGLAAFDGITGKVIKNGPAPGAAGNVLTSNGTSWVSQPVGGGSITAVATGSLSNGATVVLNSDGTVSAVAKTITALNPPTAGSLSSPAGSTTPTSFAAAYDKRRKLVFVAVNVSATIIVFVGEVFGTTITFGSSGSGGFGASASLIHGIVYDDITQQVVIAYTGATGDTFGYAYVGTPFFNGAGGRWEISFGSQIAFNSSLNTNHIALAVNPDNGTVLIGYQNSNPILVRAGTLGPRTMTLGTAATVSSSAQSTGLCYVGNNNFAVAYRSFNAPTGLYAAVVSVSGTTATVNTAINLSGTLTNAAIFCACDIAAQRLVTTYVNSSTGACLINVVSISGTTLTAGGSASISSVGTGNHVGVSFNPDAGRFVFAYVNTADSSRLYTVSGLVTGTNIALGTGGVVNSATTSTFPVSVFRNDVGDTIVGSIPNAAPRCIIVQPATITSNLTTDNFVGISDGAYTNGQTATVQIVGAVDDAQTGLTPSRRYFVGEDGLLKLVPGDWEPVVYAGTAVSATRLLIKG